MTTARQHYTRTAHRRLLTAAAVTAAVAVLTAGCSSNDGGDNKAAPTSSPGTSAPISASPPASADPQAAEKAKVLDRYAAFWVEAAKAYETGSVNGTKVVFYASDAALNETISDVTKMKQSDTAMKGAPGHRAEVSALTVSGDRPTATISDCLDLSTWQIVERSNGQVLPYPTEQPMRYVTEFDAMFLNGQWWFTKFVRHGDRTC
ncbi:hypothetical protein GCM10010260_82100 [Streptomyces filipinensis]|uniref:Lipoprotein n=1 Tax=Streptomyces filipinensis TaxID=66887 RepID=A0A918ILK0_9ACTN|nr:hypothetical protein [Streptomyces filipinensis]GGV29162.1 hypothetical protein GCM10010260_82100 [Streptomyces filipinensis]